MIDLTDEQRQEIDREEAKMAEFLIDYPDEREEDRKRWGMGRYDRDGNEISFARWAVLFEKIWYKRVADDTVGGWWISTVWLGLDHAFSMGEEHHPIIFETMIFRAEPEPAVSELLGPYMDHGDFGQWRYHTEDEAREGHERIVAQLKAGKDPAKID